MQTADADDAVNYSYVGKRHDVLVRVQCRLDGCSVQPGAERMRLSAVSEQRHLRVTPERNVQLHLHVLFHWKTLPDPAERYACSAQLFNKINILLEKQP